MTNRTPLECRWIDGDSLEHWLDVNRDLVSKFGYALITGIDGIAGVSALPSLTPFGIEPEATSLERPLLVETGKLLKMLDGGYFNGFDEIWLLRRAEDGEAFTHPPVKLHTAEFSTPPHPLELSEWMEVTGAAVGAGDGWGLIVVWKPEPQLDVMRFD